LQQFNTKHTLNTVKTVVYKTQLLIARCEQKSAFMKSWPTQLCEEFFSLFFCKGA